jgi:hypothetical protein
MCAKTRDKLVVITCGDKTREKLVVTREKCPKTREKLVVITCGDKTREHLSDDNMWSTQQSTYHKCWHSPDKNTVLINRSNQSPFLMVPIVAFAFGYMPPSPPPPTHPALRMPCSPANQNGGWGDSGVLTRRLIHNAMYLAQSNQ